MAILFSIIIRMCLLYFISCYYYQSYFFLEYVLFRFVLVVVCYPPPGGANKHDKKHMDGKQLFKTKLYSYIIIELYSYNMI